MRQPPGGALGFASPGGARLAFEQMSLSEDAAHNVGHVPSRRSTGRAAGAAILLGLLTVLVMVVLIYSNSNTPASVNGRSLTQSSYEAEAEE